MSGSHLIRLTGYGQIGDRKNWKYEIGDSIFIAYTESATHSSFFFSTSNMYVSTIIYGSKVLRCQPCKHLKDN